MTLTDIYIKNCPPSRYRCTVEYPAEGAAEIRLRLTYASPVRIGKEHWLISFAEVETSPEIWETGFVIMDNENDEPVIAAMYQAESPTLLPAAPFVFGAKADRFRWTRKPSDLMRIKAVLAQAYKERPAAQDWPVPEEEP